MNNEIHASALVSPKARIGERNLIGPYVIVDDDVVIGSDNKLFSHSVLKSGTRIGDGNELHDHSVIGGSPQVLKFKGAESYVFIGHRNVLREGVTVHRASREKSATVIGDDNFLMANAHVAHDCVVEDQTVIANNVALAGEVRVEKQVFVSGGVVIHQFVRLGRLAMIGGNSKITQDVLPFFITDGVPGRVRGLNLVGLRRAGFQSTEIRDIKEAFKILLRSHMLLETSLDQLGKIASPHVTHLHDFVSSSQRGFHH